MYIYIHIYIYIYNRYIYNIYIYNIKIRTEESNEEKEGNVQCPRSSGNSRHYFYIS